MACDVGFYQIITTKKKEKEKRKKKAFEKAGGAFCQGFSKKYYPT